MLSPERSIEIQRLLGSDIVMAVRPARCPPPAGDEQAAAMERSIRWARRSRDGFDGGGEHAGAPLCSASSRGRWTRGCAAPRPTG
jgi:queuine tRNA-ribosyltransferase